ncbi:MAG: hypothetical protein MK193_04275 [Lentisphaeria bacterium]|nr:hypothetical protein [Lentisphaeria bacterium]
MAGHRVYRSHAEDHLVFIVLEGELYYQCNDFSGIVKHGDLLFISVYHMHELWGGEVKGLWFLLDPSHLKW